MIDILYLAYHRPEFTSESLSALIAKTDWSKARLCIYTDGDSLKWWNFNGEYAVNPNRYGGPVACMNAYLERPGAEILCKIDNDVIVPPDWLDRSLAVMEAHPELDLLGIEPPMSRTRPAGNSGPRIPAPELTGPVTSLPGNGFGYAPCRSIGGVGLMRRSAFARGKMMPHGFNGVGGFTDWQIAHPEVVKGWITPPLDLFLLDRMPQPRWRRLSEEYIAKQWQRPWGLYDEADHALWDWWQPVT